MAIGEFAVVDLLPVLGSFEIKRQLRRVAGVDRVWVDPVSGLAVVVYDSAETSVAAIQAAISQIKPPDARAHPGHERGGRPCQSARSR
jgi:copper chaperone CopZ